MATWFTADTHFGLAREASARGFADAEAMDRALVAAWNARVAPSDTVWHLGDFGGDGPASAMAAAFSALNGRKLLVAGNWDEEHGHALDLPWDAPPEKHVVADVGGRRVFLCHYPSLSWPLMRYGGLHLYGHTHGWVRGSAGSADVGVDAWGLAPVSLDEALARMATLPKDYGLPGTASALAA